MRHCWADEGASLEWLSDAWLEYWTRREGGQSGGTCLLEAGHDGPHAWMRDDEIVVEFSALPPSEQDAVGR